MRFIDVINYFKDWACPYKRAFWSILFLDGPLVTFDFGILYVYFWNPELLNAIGQSVGIATGLSGLYLTYLRIKQVRRDLNEKKDDG